MFFKLKRDFVMLLQFETFLDFFFKLISGAAAATKVYERVENVKSEEET